jgi:competence protein ComEC
MKKTDDSVFWIAYPIIKIGIAFVLGILTAYQTNVSFWIAGILAITFLILSFFTHHHDKTTISAHIGIYGLVFCAGFLRMESTQIQKNQIFNNVQSWAKASDSLLITGKILTNKLGERSISYDIQVSTLCINDSLFYDEPFKARLIVYQDNPVQASLLVQNTLIALWAKHKPVSEPRNPFLFNYADFLLSRDIMAQFEWVELQSQSPPKGFDALKPIFEQSIESIFTGSNAAIAKALIIGDKTDINPELRQQFTRSGLAHLMAVSGLHVGFLVAPFWFLIPWLWTKSWGRIVGIISLGLGLLFYAWLTGFSASVVRASIMAFLFSYAKLFEKVRYPMNIVGFAALFLLAINPFYLFDVGFQLSFGAVSIILLVMPTFSKLTQKQTWTYKIISSMLVGVVVQLGLSPILALYFGEISLISPISNVFAMIPASLMVQLGLISTILCIPFPFLASWVSYPLNYLAFTLQFFARYFSDSDLSYAAVTSPNPFFFVFWFCFLATVAAWTNGKQRWKWLVFTLIALFIWRSNHLIHYFEKKTLQVTVLDVGQGDATLIETSDNRVMLIDTGVWSPNYNSGDRVILPVLKAKNISRIHALVLSHPHADHIGGTLPIIEHIQIDTLYTDTSLVEDRSRLFQHILDKAREKSIPIKELYLGNQIWFSNEVNTRILWPVSGFKTNNTNEVSTILRLDYGKTSFLFTGDAEHEAEEFLAEFANEMLDTDYLKVGHHGSKSSSHQPFLEDITPEFASVSLGFQNKYRHPHAESMFRLQQFTKSIHFTSLEGAAVYQSDGNSIKQIRWKD